MLILIRTYNYVISDLCFVLDGDRPNKLKPWSIKGAVQVIFPGMLSALPHRYDLQESLLETKVAEEDTPNDEDVNSKGTGQSSSIPQIQLLADSSDFRQKSEQAHYEMSDCEHNLKLNLNGDNDKETVHCSQLQVSNRVTEELSLTLSSQCESFQESPLNSSCSDDEMEYASVSQVQLPTDKMLFTETLQSSSYMYVPSQVCYMFMLCTLMESCTHVHFLHSKHVALV